MAVKLIAPPDVTVRSVLSPSIFSPVPNVIPTFAGTTTSVPAVRLIAPDAVTVVVAAVWLNTAPPSAVLVIVPFEPVSATATLVLRTVIFALSSTYFLFATSPSALGAAVASPTIVFAEAEITISPTSIPLLTLKFLVVMVPYLPHDCCYCCI